MTTSRSFALDLPPDYPVELGLQYLGRDFHSLTVRVDGRSFGLGLWIGGIPCLLRADFEGGSVRATLEAGGRLPAGAVDQGRDHLRRLLGLNLDPGPFERLVSASPELAPLVAGRRGLRIPQVPDPFDGLMWVILGQQITLAFAFTLRRRLVERAGALTPGGLFAPPRAEAVANLEVEELMGVQFSRRKAEYLTGVARRIADGGLDLGRLAASPPAEVEAALLAVRGLGPWSAHYLMMRVFGFEDCVPVGDAGLVRALANFFALPERPGAARTQELMRPFAPYRSWATFHLWQSLKDVS